MVDFNIARENYKASKAHSDSKNPSLEGLSPKDTEILTKLSFLKLDKVPLDLAKSVIRSEKENSPSLKKEFVTDEAYFDHSTNSFVLSDSLSQQLRSKAKFDKTEQNLFTEVRNGITFQINNHLGSGELNAISTEAFINICKEDSQIDREFSLYNLLPSLTPEEGHNFYYLCKKLTSTASLFTLGTIYENGIKTEVDYSKAYYWYNQSAGVDPKDARPYLKLGEFYLDGKGVNNDPKAAYENFHKVTELSFNVFSRFYEFVSFGMSKLGISEQNDTFWYAKAAQSIKELVNKNFIHICSKQIEDERKQICFESQRQFEEDYIIIGKKFQDYTYIMKAAEDGQASAQFKIGLNYEEGSNKITQDYEEAVRWYKASSQKGHTDSLVHLAKLLEDQKIKDTVVEDSVADLYTSAAKHEMFRALQADNYTHYKGNGVSFFMNRMPMPYKKVASEDYRENGFSWWQDLAENNNKFAQANLAFLYKQGSKVEGSKAENKHWCYESLEVENTFSYDDIALRGRIFEISVPYLNPEYEYTCKDYFHHSQTPGSFADFFRIQINTDVNNEGIYFGRNDIRERFVLHNHLNGQNIYIKSFDASNNGDYLDFSNIDNVNSREDLSFEGSISFLERVESSIKIINVNTKETLVELVDLRTIHNVPQLDINIRFDQSDEYSLNPKLFSVTNFIGITMGIGVAVITAMELYNTVLNGEIQHDHIE
ncbi:MAG: tetratricopeptide repeat protein [Rickettsiales bacterium]